jgi:hypothetical protein
VFADRYEQGAYPKMSEIESANNDENQERWTKEIKRRGRVGTKRD